MIIKKHGDYKIVKDGTSYYRVLRKRTRIGSFLLLPDAEKYFNSVIKKEMEK
ncbi:hypothetical protein AB3N02_22180 [Priestia aryabhattai]|uniref:hypothetical protein n=1 Tax=Priestia aryabhattai TaxID=412384 RepID=UPI0039A17700